MTLPSASGLPRTIHVVGYARTAIGSFGGSLKDVPLKELATQVVRVALERSGASARSVGHVVMGNVVPTEPHDAYLSRIAAIGAGIPDSVPAFNVNRLCGSGLQAVVSAAQAICLGEASVAVAAGAESMSRGGYLTPSARWGARLGDTVMLDYMNTILHDPFSGLHMGITAENVASRFNISRQDQDALALESQRRASQAIQAGHFVDQITPVTVRQGRKDVVFDTDEHVRPKVSAERLATMKPVFKADGSVTAGNASGINDGAAALVLADEQTLAEQGLTSLARLVSWAHTGVDPQLMGIGPVSASRLALARAGLTIEDIDVIESNEAFAAQACAVTRELGLDPARVNPNGSGISLGHPVGATGCIIAIKAIAELHRTGGTHALVTMCIGGGQGIAAIFQRS